MNPFTLAVKTALDKKFTAKDYLIKTKGKTEEQVAVIITELANPVPKG